MFLSTLLGFGWRKVGKDRRYRLSIVAEGRGTDSQEAGRDLGEVAAFGPAIDMDLIWDRDGSGVRTACYIVLEWCEPTMAELLSPKLGRPAARRQAARIRVTFASQFFADWLDWSGDMLVSYESGRAVVVDSALPGPVAAAHRATDRSLQVATDLLSRPEGLLSHQRSMRYWDFVAAMLFYLEVGRFELAEEFARVAFELPAETVSPAELELATLVLDRTGTAPG